MSPFDLLDLLGGTLVRGGLILTAAFAGATLLRRRSAAGRYAVWTAAFAGLCLLPALTLVLPVLEPPAIGRAESPAVRMAGGSMAGAHPSASMAADGATLSDMRSATRSSVAAMRPPTASSMGDRGEPMVARRAESGSIGAAIRPLARKAAPWLLALWLIGSLFVLARLGRDVFLFSCLLRWSLTTPGQVDFEIVLRPVDRRH